MEDGRAIIRAWEGKADVSSIAHELVTSSAATYKTVTCIIIEQWAEVKTGNWTRAAEEKFARGFENISQTGAPYPETSPRV